MERERIGNYKILNKAGEGAFGKVWHVEHVETKKEMAIKQIAKKRMTEQLMENLKREVKISYELTHKSLIKCFNTMESKNNYYIVFEYCSGGDLSKYLKKKKHIDLQMGLDLIKQIKNAYKYLMSENILHRDIKLENILLQDHESMQIKISDFGCSKIDPMGTTICGTPKYMALELLEGVKNYDYKVDLWSIGLCFWELLYGYKNFPFSLKSRADLKKEIKKYSGKNLRFPTVPKFPEEFYDFFRKILEVSPRLRMDCDQFISHAIFNFTGSEQIFSDIKSKKNVENKEKGDVEFESTKIENESIFKTNKEVYQKKITEIELIKDTLATLKNYTKDEWEKEFLTNFESLVIILIKKAIYKVDLALTTFKKKKNLFKLKKFKEFLKYPNEYVELKSDLEKIKEDLKKIDKEIYSNLIRDCFSESYLEMLNDCLYRNKASKTEKSKFISSTWKYIYKNYKELIDDYEKAAFDKTLTRTSIILKGQVLEKIQKFY